MMKTLKEFFAIKVVLIALILTVGIGLLGLGIFLTIGWVKVTEAQPLPPFDPSTRTLSMCPAVGRYAPPLGFPFEYFLWTNMDEPDSISIPIWRIEACGIPSFVNPLAFLGNFVLFLAVAYLYRRWKAKKANSTSPTVSADSSG